jgi:hypothetical protein
MVNSEIPKRKVDKVHMNKRKIRDLEKKGLSKIRSNSNLLEVHKFCLANLKKKKIMD